MPDDPQRLAAFWQALRQHPARTASELNKLKPLVTLDRTRLTMDEVWMLWRDGFDVSAELERRML